MKNLFVILAFVSLANAKPKQHREHHAHVHGAATLAIAFDGLNGKAELKGAAEALLGFEHEAKTENDKKILAQTILQMENNITQMIQLDPSLKCVFSKDKIEMTKEHGGHADFVANYNIRCEKSPLSTKIKIDFSALARIKDLDVTILVDHLQKSVEIKGTPITIELK